MHQLLSSVKFINGTAKEMNNSEWFKWFDLKKLETKKRKFGYSIQTDGIAISVSMSEIIQKQEIPKKKIKLENETLSNVKDLLNVRKNLKDEKYKQFIGLDPGFRLVMGGIAINEEKPKRLIKISSNQYHHLAGYNTRKYKLNKFTNDIDEKYKNTIEPFNYIEYTIHRLKHFEEKQSVYCQRKVGRLKFQKFICSEIAAKHIAHKIVDNQKHKSLVLLGDTEFAANSPIRGYVRTPNKKIVKHLKNIADVLRVNEFRTTKLCSCCFEPVCTSKSPHRYQFCQKCNIVWNRDVNAGKNILQLGLYNNILGQEKPDNFKK